jgi:undecaprenyl diphosphate synthase
MKQGCEKSRNTLNSIAIIMDGNGRWAKKRGLPRSAGHAEGAKNLIEVLKILREKDIHHLTLYAFSTENWKRPKEEVDGLMELIYKYVDEMVIGILKKEKDLSIKFIGDKSKLPEKLRNKCIEAEEMAKDRPYVCNVALNYGGRDEIVRACNRLIKAGNKSVDEQSFAAALDTAGTGDPDLIVRTGGDLRISNFLLWQAAYAEFYFTPTLWPDLTKDEVDKAIADFLGRHRRFGGL